jgi:conjugative transposon TraM protein
MKHSQKFLQKRKFVMALPILALPFLTMIFWALGGGKGTPAQAMIIESPGLNLELPSAHFNEEEVDKLSLYEKAERELRKFQEEQESDPYFNLTAFETEEMQEVKEHPTNQNSSTGSGRLKNYTPQKQQPSIDPNEAKVNQKLEQLYRELNKTPELVQSNTSQYENTNSTDPQFSSDVKELEKMMEMMSRGSEPDPEMQQLESMLEKILDIQHPDRVRTKINAQSEQQTKPTFSVTAPTDNTVSLLHSANQTDQNSFYGLDDGSESQVIANTIEAVVHDTQELVDGATVKMRLLNDVYINNTLIPKDQFMYGTCSIKGERLTIDIKSVRTGNSILPVSLVVYDLDGLEGIYIPGAIARDVVKQSSEEALQGIQFMSLDPSLGAQAAGAGIEAAKGLFSKKAKLIKVTVKAGYQILLKDTNPSTNKDF